MSSTVTFRNSWVTGLSNLKDSIPNIFAMV
jgi:hypothetical protein